MKFNIDTPTLRPWLRAIEPSLPMLATRAAVELDALRRGSPGKMDAVKELSQLLTNSFDQEYENEGTHRAGSLLDPSTMVLVGRALEKIPDKRVTKVAEVQEMMREVKRLQILLRPLLLLMLPQSSMSIVTRMQIVMPQMKFRI